MACWVYEGLLLFGVVFIAGYLFGGVISEVYGWRVAFMVAGIPGILLAVLLVVDGTGREARASFGAAPMDVIKRRAASASSCRGGAKARAGRRRRA